RARTRGDGSRHCWPDEQADRRRTAAERDYRQDPPRTRHAENGRALARRPGEGGGSAGCSAGPSRRADRAKATELPSCQEFSFKGVVAFARSQSLIEASWMKAR